MTDRKTLDILVPAGFVPAVSLVAAREIMRRLFSLRKGDDEQERQQIISPLYLSPQGRYLEEPLGRGWGI